MPTKKTKPKKAAGKAAASGYACNVCGAFAVIDPVCGCGEEHVFICCGEPMKKAVAKKPAPKKAGKK